MTLSRVSSVAAVGACAATFALALGACSSSTEKPAASTPSTAEVVASSVTEAAGPDSACPTTPPANGATPQWTLSGATGNVAVTGSTDTAAPAVKVTAPFSVKETQVHTLQAGDGPVVAPTATVSVCYMGVNGRDGSVFDSAYQRGEPAEFSLDGVVPGFQKAIAGQKVGSTVAVAMVPADGYPQGQPAAGILPGDTLVFAIKILSASS
ncbi:FKBP-type peptidyl-prolyl cis-trans isomerase [Mycolicibacterium sp. CBM1]